MTLSNGPEILAAVRQIRTLMVEVSKLLLELDAIVGAVGWKPMAGSTALSNGSLSVNSPKNWIPYRAFRFYRHEQLPKTVACAAVVLEGFPSQERATEPLVTGVVMEYESPEALPEGNALYNISTWHLHLPQRKDDGTVMSVVPRDLWKEYTTASSMRSFAVPLVSIDSRARLEQAVGNPLLMMARTPAAL